GHTEVHVRREAPVQLHLAQTIRIALGAGAKVEAAEVDRRAELVDAGWRQEDGGQGGPEPLDARTPRELRGGGRGKRERLRELRPDRLHGQAPMITAGRCS